MLCAGGAVVDLKIHLSAPSVAGTSNPGSGTTSFGGVARNVAENLAALGVDTAVLSAVGDDAAGAALLAGLERRGISTAHVAVLPGQSTAQYVALLEPDGELTIGAAAMAVLDRIEPEHLAAAWPTRSGDWVFCDGNLSAPVLAMALERGRRSATAVAFDAVSTHKMTRLPGDLRGLDLLCCNRDEARAWLAQHRPDIAAIDPVGSDPVDQAGQADHADLALARVLHTAGARAVLLTRGAAGLVVVSAAGEARIPAVPAHVVDVTGAGDALVGATLAALVGGADLVAAATAGAERAARTVASPHSVLPSPFTRTTTGPVR